MKTFQILLIATFALALAGCSTVGKRIEEKSAVFNSLDAQTQERLKQSVIHVGDSADMVYIALGRPDRIREKTTTKGQEQTWIYSTFRQEYEGTHFVGYRRHAYFTGNAWHIYYEPVHADFYRDRMEEYMRITFDAGKVTAIEQTKD